MQFPKNQIAATCLSYCLHGKGTPHWLYAHLPISEKPKNDRGNQEWVGLWRTKLMAGFNAMGKQLQKASCDLLE